MYDYMQALQEKFFSDDAYAEQRQEIEAMRCKLSHTLDKQRRKQLLQLVDAESQLRGDMSLASFIAGFRLACGIGSELGKGNWYSYMKDEEQRLREAFDETSKELSIWYDFFYTELTTGLRRGEICGLMWSDFNGHSGTLKVNRTLHREKGGRLVAGDTKTYAGTRKIVLPPSTVQLLCARKQKSFSPWIFHDPLRPEASIAPDSAYRQLKKFLSEAGLPNIRFHGLRHTFSTHALASGVDAKTLAGILGHTNPYLTLMRSNFSGMRSAPNQRNSHIAIACTQSMGKPAISRSG